MLYLTLPSHTRRPIRPRPWRWSHGEGFVQCRVWICQLTNWDMIWYDSKLWPDEVGHDSTWLSNFNFVQDWTHGISKLKLARSISLSTNFHLFPRLDFEVLYDSLDIHRFSAWSVGMWCPAASWSLAVVHITGRSWNVIHQTSMTLFEFKHVQTNVLSSQEEGVETRTTNHRRGAMRSTRLNRTRSVKHQ